MRSKRFSITCDQDVYDFITATAGRRGLSRAQAVRWLLRDGMAHRMELERQYRGLAVEEAKYGR